MNNPRAQHKRKGAGRIQKRKYDDSRLESIGADRSSSKSCTRVNGILKAVEQNPDSPSLLSALIHCSLVDIPCEVFQQPYSSIDEGKLEIQCVSDSSGRSTVASPDGSYSGEVNVL
jgi:hypothetical protein